MNFLSSQWCKLRHVGIIDKNKLFNLTGVNKKIDFSIHLFGIAVSSVRVHVP